jgi:hypothetical protein
LDNDRERVRELQEQLGVLRTVRAKRKMEAAKKAGDAAEEPNDVGKSKKETTGKLIQKLCQSREPGGCRLLNRHGKFATYQCNFPQR